MGVHIKGKIPFLQTVMQQLYIHQRIICIPFCIYAVQIIIWSDSIQALSCHSKSRTLRLFQHFIALHTPTFHILSKFKSCENKILKDWEYDETFRKQNNPYCAVERMNRLTIKILLCVCSFTWALLFLYCITAIQPQRNSQFGGWMLLYCIGLLICNDIIGVKLSP